MVSLDLKLTASAASGLSALSEALRLGSQTLTPAVLLLQQECCPVSRSARCSESASGGLGKSGDALK